MIIVSVKEYLDILKRLWIRGRSVIDEWGANHYKVYLPIEYNEIWSRINIEKRLVDVIVILPEPVNTIDKIPMMNKKIVKEGDRYKLYLPRKYNDLWRKLCNEGKKVDLIVAIE